jgi:hypothetical protein
MLLRGRLMNLVIQLLYLLLLLVVLLLHFV